MTEETTADDKTKFLRTLFLRWHPDKVLPLRPFVKELRA
jgi:preprotein translocase subunit Sec63